MIILLAAFYVNWTLAQFGPNGVSGNILSFAILEPKAARARDTLVRLGRFAAKPWPEKQVILRRRWGRFFQSRIAPSPAGNSRANMLYNSS